MTSPVVFTQLPREQSRHQMVVSRLREAIAQGHLAIGERLPSERELCEQLGVSRTIVREAMRVWHPRAFLPYARGDMPWWRPTLVPSTCVRCAG